ncbi:MAG: SusF/SusE family outer membrane protein [Bacteroidales bacterium]|nr:SusF/SusE family outer membrane protein [Candidatus Sodaliphilus limicaballi]
MKKFFASMCLAAATIFGMQAANVYILGNCGAGTAWDPANPVEMQTTDGNVFTFTNDFEASSYFSFTTAKGTWDEIHDFRVAAPTNNYAINANNFDQVIACNEMGIDTDNAFLIEAAGNYTLTFNLEELTLVVHPNGEVKPEEIVPDGLYIMGTVNGQNWNTNEGTKMTTADNVVYKANIEIADSAANFSFTKALSQTASNWAGIAQYRFGALYNQYSVTEELGEAIALGDDGTDYSFELAQGFYEVTVDLNARTMTVVSTDEPAQKYYVIGSAFGNWDPKNPVELVQDGDNYTCEFEFTGDNYFVFTGAKGSWDAINAFRFGPLEANEDVTEGVETATQLSTNGDASYKMVCDGKYVVTFNPTALTFTVKAAAGPEPEPIKGDINNDGTVDITDANILFNVVLGIDTTLYPHADVTGDGTVDISDANAVINIILGAK